MAVAVLAPDDGVEITADGNVLVGERTLASEADVNALRALLETHPRWEVVRLRVWAVLLEVIDYKFRALYPAGEDVSGPEQQEQSTRLAKVDLLCKGQGDLLVAAYELLQALQARWAELDVVREYLAEMQA